MRERRRMVWPDGCGGGLWCEACRHEVREEALRWLRALNVMPGEPDPDAVAVVERPWSPQLQPAGR